MNVQTTRFGLIQVEDDRVISFPSGLLGFASYKRFVLLQPDDHGVFFWLQSVDSPELAFVVTDPSLWVSDYQVNIREEQMSELVLDRLEDAQVFVIVNKRDRTLTGNFQGPLVVNTTNHKAMQMVLAEKRWTTRQELVHLGDVAQAVPA